MLSRSDRASRRPRPALLVLAVVVGLLLMHVLVSSPAYAHAAGESVVAHGGPHAADQDAVESSCGHDAATDHCAIACTPLPPHSAAPAAPDGGPAALAPRHRPLLHLGRAAPPTTPDLHALSICRT